MPREVTSNLGRFSASNRTPFSLAGWQSLTSHCYLRAVGLVDGTGLSAPAELKFILATTCTYHIRKTNNHGLQFSVYARQYRGFSTVSLPYAGYVVRSCTAIAA